MKKLISLFLALVMTFALTGIASAEGTPTFVISEATAAPGEEVSVTVSIENNPGICGVMLSADYDHDVLTLTDVQRGTYTSGSWLAMEPKTDAFWVDGHNDTHDGLFATLIFTVAANAAAGDYEVSVHYDEDEVYNDNYDNIYFAVQPGKVTVKQPETAYYLIGSMTNWAVDETYKFTRNTEAEGEEYILNVANLGVGTQLKVVSATGTTTNTWYPGGSNYTVDYDHSGNVNVYFRPAGNVWNSFHEGGFFYISKLHTVTVVTDGNGTASVDPAAPDVSATVTLTATANDGYHFDHVEFYQKIGSGENDITPVTLDWNAQDKTFTMPGYDVVIKVYFAAHTYGEASYTWAADNSSVTATAACTACGHEETETVSTTSEVTTQPTCEGKGKTTYTATFENEAFTVQTKEVENIDPLGHNWGEPTWTWDGVTSATATFTCSRDSSHTQSVTATGEAIVSEVGTGEDEGYLVYTATVTFNGQTYTDKKKIENAFTITFEDGDGNVLESKTLASGDTPVYTGEEPTKPFYTFAGWDGLPETMPAHDVTVTAQWTPITAYYLIKGEPGDGNWPLLEENRFIENEVVPGEYILANTKTPEVGKGLKVVKAVGTTITDWYPDGTEGEHQHVVPGCSSTDYIVDVNHAPDADDPDSTVTVYFRPEGRTDDLAWLWRPFGGFMYIEKDHKITINVIGGNGTQPTTMNHEDSTPLDDEAPQLMTVCVVGQPNTGYTLVYIDSPDLDTEENQVRFIDNGIIFVMPDYPITINVKYELIQYNVTFKNWDGTELQSGKVDYGTAPVYNGGTPTKPSDAEHIYTFSGWSDGTHTYAPDEALPVAYADAVYTAQFADAANQYTIKFVNTDGTVLQESLWAYGATPVYSGAAPEQEADAQYTYTFAGWDPEITAVTGEATYTATYTKTLRSYTIKFVNTDGTVLQQSDWEYNTTPVYSGETPEQEADAQYTYTFAGWDPEIAAVTGEATYTATYTKTLRSYTIKFVSENGETVLQESDWAYGETPVYSGEEPTKEAAEGHTYAFIGWTPSIKPVTGEATYTATFSDTADTFTVAYVDYLHGKVLQLSVVPYGEATPAFKGTLPTADGWRVDPEHPWTTEIEETVVRDTVYVLKWIRTYKVTFDPDDGTEAIVVTVDRGEKIKAEDIPEVTKEGFIFGGWYEYSLPFDTDAPIVRDVAVKAKWLIKVTLDPDNGEEAMEVTTEAGALLMAPETPSKEGCVFAGWYNGENLFNFNAPVTTAITLTAHWKTITQVVYSQGSVQYIDTTPYVMYGKTMHEPSFTVQDEAGNVIPDGYTVLYQYDTEAGTGNLQIIFKEDSLYADCTSLFNLYVPGDANCDGKVTSADAASVLRSLVGLSVLSEKGELDANVDGNDAITAGDAALILRYLVNLIEEFPIEQ